MVFQIEINEDLKNYPERENIIIFNGIFTFFCILYYNNIVGRKFHVGGNNNDDANTIIDQ